MTSRDGGAAGAVPGMPRLWFGFLGPPVIWAIRLSASYALVPLVCRMGWSWLINVVTLAALAGITLAGAVAYGSWRRAGHASEPGRARRIRFMGLVGMLIAALFFAVVVAEGLANFMVEPCIPGGAPL